MAALFVESGMSVAGVVLPPPGYLQHAYAHVRAQGGEQGEEAVGVVVVVEDGLRAFEELELGGVWRPGEVEADAGAEVGFPVVRGAVPRPVGEVRPPGAHAVHGEVPVRRFGLIGADEAKMGHDGSEWWWFGVRCCP